jgi:serine/threonine protein phosphatase PrpC
MPNNDDLDIPDFVKNSGRSPVARTETQSDANKCLIWSDDLKSEIFPSSLLSRHLSFADLLLEHPVEKADGSALWVGKFGLRGIGLMLSGGLSARSENISEDAPPLVAVRQTPLGDTALTFAVFDGMGGAGSSMMQVKTVGSPVECSQAYIASRIVRNVLKEIAITNVGLKIHDLEARLKLKLSEFSSENGILEGSKIRGSMTKRLPTTVAAVRCDIPTQTTFYRTQTIEAIWAGDSRIYVMSPSRGLSVVSKDDVRSTDALEQLRTDPPIDNVVNESVPFKLNQKKVSVEVPCIVIAATDGLFGYLYTPGYLEFLVLDCLSKAQTMPEFTSILLKEASTFAADDISFVVAFLGFGTDLEKVRLSFRARYERLKVLYQPLLGKPLDEDSEPLIESIWNIEKHSFNWFTGEDNE